MISEWLYEKKNIFDLKFKDFQWPQEYGLRLFDFECEIKVNGEQYVGRGTDANQGLALEKASAEAIERAVCAIQGIGTEGVALHTSPQRALLNSQNEALERFLLDWHLQNGKQATRLHNESLGMSEQIEAVQKCISKEVDVNFYSLNAPESFNVIFCLIEFEQQGFFGIACDHLQKNVVQKCFQEAIRNLVAYRQNPEKYFLELQSNKDLWCGDRVYTDKLKKLELMEVSKTEIPEIIFDSAPIEIDKIFTSNRISFYMSKTVIKSRFS